MAAANEVLKLTVSERISIGKGRSLYIGTVEGGSEYKTGGVEIVDSGNSRVTVPTKWDIFAIPGTNLPAKLAAVGGNLVKFFKGVPVAGEEAGTLTELAAAKTLATAVPAGTSFLGIGAS